MRGRRAREQATTSLSLYWPGESWLHRLPAGVKLAALVAVSTAVMTIDRPVVSLGTLLAAAALTVSAGVPPPIVLRQTRPFIVVTLLLVTVQAALGRLEEGLVAACRLLAVAAVAVAVTLTTRSADLVAWFERMLSALRFRPRTVFRAGLTVGLALRSIDHLGVVAHRVLDARRARGLQRSVRAFAVPTVVAAARFAHGVGEALEARGIADPDLARRARERG
jgi:biotin transport system permease protein